MSEKMEKVILRIYYCIFTVAAWLYLYAEFPFAKIDFVYEGY